MAHELHHRQERAQGSSDRTLGLVFATVFVVVGAYPRLAGGEWRIWALVVACAFAATALAVPRLLAPLNRAWTHLGELLHAVMNPVLLGFIFFVVITPMGWVMRMLGKDPLRLRFDPQLPSYWVERTPPGPKPDTFTDQF